MIHKSIKALAVLVIITSVTAHAFAANDAFYIEDETLTPVSGGIEFAIKSNPTWKGCNFVGKKIILSKDTSQSFFAVTTDKACGWGAAQGPIWIVKTVNDKADILLAGQGYNLTIEDKTHEGLPNILLETATAGNETKYVWHFDGSHYKLGKFTSGPPQ
jgi:hypothetical protein